MSDVAYALRAIANETRLSIIFLLSRDGELSVNQLVELLKCEQSLVSHHLTDMRAKGILNARRKGKNCFYSLRNEQIIQIIHCIKSCDCAKQQE